VFAKSCQKNFDCKSSCQLSRHAFSSARLVHSVPPLLGCMALLCSGLSNFYCESFKAGDSLDYSLWSYRRVEWGEIGLGQSSYAREVHSCEALPGGIDADASWKAARAFSVMALFWGGLMTFFLCFTPCSYHSSKLRWTILSTQLIAVLPFFQALTFLAFASDLCREPDSLMENVFVQVDGGSCSWSSGSTASVFACLLWLLAGLGLLWLGVPVRETSPPTLHQVTYQRTVNADGTTTVTETAVVKTEVTADA